MNKDIAIRLNAAAELTKKLYPNGTFYEAFVEAVRLCAELHARMDASKPSDAILLERLEKLANKIF